MRHSPGRDKPAAVYALIRFDGAADCQVAEVVVAFDNPGRADDFARTAGIDAYAVAPLAFDSSPGPSRVSRPAG